MFDLTLSFDNGPDPDVTPGVLAALRERGILATFFVLGHKLAMPGCRALAEQAHAEGHWIGNHTWTHSTPLGLCEAPDTAEAEVGQTQRVMGDLAHPDRLFRPFGHAVMDQRLLSVPVVDYLRQGAYSCVLWNSIPRDWEDPVAWIERGLGQCAAQPWSLMVLHDLPTGAMANLPRFLDAVLDQGGRFRQELPPDCVPIQRGQVVAPIDAYVNGDLH